MKVVIIMSLIFAFACSAKKDKNAFLTVKLYPSIFRDTVHLRNFFVVCQEVENNTDSDLYTSQPSIVVYDAKENFYYTSFHDELRSEGMGSGKYQRFSSTPFYRIDADVANDIRTDSVLKAFSEQTEYKQVVDSFISFRYGLMDRAFDSLDVHLERGVWLFIKAHTRSKKYYLLELQALHRGETGAIKVRTLHPNEKGNYMFENTKRFPMPDSFSGYKAYKDYLDADSLIIPILYQE